MILETKAPPLCLKYLMVGSMRKLSSLHTAQDTAGPSHNLLFIQSSHHISVLVSISQHSAMTGGQLLARLGAWRVGGAKYDRGRSVTAGTHRTMGLNTPLPLEHGGHLALGPASRDQCLVKVATKFRGTQ